MSFYFVSYLDWVNRRVDLLKIGSMGRQPIFFLIVEFEKTTSVLLLHHFSIVIKILFQLYQIRTFVSTTVKNYDKRGIFL